MILHLFLLFGVANGLLYFYSVPIMDIKLTIELLLIGQPRPFREDGATSAIHKKPVHGAVYLTKTGFTGDQVADPVHHGGEDKAVHHYFRDHYPYWQQFLGGNNVLDNPGAFGENISTKGMIESEIRVGDIFRMGKALVQVSHGRQPCWKLDHLFGVSGKQSVMNEIIRTKKCGIYYRVLEEGNVAAGDMLSLVERGTARWTVDRVFHLIIGGGWRDEPELLDELAALETLATVWRKRAEDLAG